VLFDRCPPEEALAAFVAGVTSPKIERHVAHCEACAQIVRQFRQDEAWLQNVRRATQESPDPGSRRKIGRICREAGQSENQ
jgi:hypothetical protein